MPPRTLGEMKSQAKINRVLGFRLSSFLDSYCSGYARLSLHMQPSLFILCIQFSILLGVESLRQEMNYIIIKKKSCDHCN